MYIEHGAWEFNNALGGNTGHGSSIMHGGNLSIAIKLAKCGNELGKISTYGKNIFSHGI
jgi:hypothetical protein